MEIDTIKHHEALGLDGFEMISLIAWVERCVILQVPNYHLTYISELPLQPYTSISKGQHSTASRLWYHQLTMKLPTTLALAILPLLITAQQQKGWLFETSSGRAQGIGSRSCQRFYLKKSENWTVKLEPMKKSKKVRSASPEPQSGWGDAGWGNGNTSPPSQNGGGWGNGNLPPPSQNGAGYGNAPIQNGGGTWNPVPDPNAWVPMSQLPPSNNGGGSPPASWTPPPQNQPAPNKQTPPPQSNNRPPPQNNNKPPSQNSNGGTWNGSKAPPTNNNRPPSQNNGGRPPQNNGGQWNGPVSGPPPPLKCCVKIYLDDDCKDTYDEGCVVDKNDGRFDKGKASKDAKSFNVICT